MEFVAPKLEVLTERKQSQHNETTGVMLTRWHVGEMQSRRCKHWWRVRNHVRLVRDKDAAVNLASADKEGKSQRKANSGCNPAANSVNTAVVRKQLYAITVVSVANCSKMLTNLHGVAFEAPRQQHTVSSIEHLQRPSV
jgi:hypothetical protein